LEHLLGDGEFGIFGPDRFVFVAGQQRQDITLTCDIELTEILYREELAHEVPRRL
jgi:hypothetical protein